VLLQLTEEAPLLVFQSLLCSLLRTLGHSVTTSLGGGGGGGGGGSGAVVVAISTKYSILE
jgi:hypothetical protein